MKKEELIKQLKNFFNGKEGLLLETMINLRGDEIATKWLEIEDNKKNITGKLILLQILQEWIKLAGVGFL